MNAEIKSRANELYVGMLERMTNEMDGGFDEQVSAITQKLFMHIAFLIARVDELEKREPAVNP